MQVSEKSEELYDKLSKQIEANDDAAARGIFQELLNNGFSRQEIVVRVSRLIEKRSASKTGGVPTDKIGWLRPHLPVEPSVSDARKRPNASGRASMPNARPVDNTAEKSSASSGISSDRFTLSVPERLAAKLQLQKDSKLAERTLIKWLKERESANLTKSVEAFVRLFKPVPYVPDKGIENVLKDLANQRPVPKELIGHPELFRDHGPLERAISRQ